MTTRSTRSEMLANGLSKGATADTPLITSRPRLSTFDLRGFDGTYLGTVTAPSAQNALDQWELVAHSERVGLVEEMD